MVKKGGGETKERRKVLLSEAACASAMPEWLTDFEAGRCAEHWRLLATRSYVVYE